LAAYGIEAGIRQPTSPLKPSEIGPKRAIDAVAPNIRADHSACRERLSKGRIADPIFDGRVVAHDTVLLSAAARFHVNISELAGV
jgi:hypothetical protein